MVVKTQNNNGNLYVSMDSFKDKRRNLLFSLKDSLTLQEEYEKVTEIRKHKEEVLTQIKKKMNDLNSLYQKLKKLLPSVKGAISNTEKELSVLDRHFTTLTHQDKKGEKEHEKTQKHTAKSTTHTSRKQKHATNNNRTKATGYVSEKASEKIKEDISKLDRIRNNLRVIESKLKKA